MENQRSTGVEAVRSGYIPEHMTNLEDVANKLDNAAGELHRLADRLLGTSPEKEPSNDVPTPVPNGLIAECNERSDSLLQLADRILFAVERLNQVA